MKKNERYRRVMRFLVAAIPIICFTILFSCVWYKYFVYSGMLTGSFFYKKNYIVIALYALILFFFHKVFGNFKIGSGRIVETLFSQIVAVVLTNIVAYLQCYLIGHWAWLDQVAPFVILVVVEAGFMTAWTFVVRLMYLRLNSQRQLLLIYGQYDPERLIDKMHSWENKYNIKEIISVDVGMNMIMDKLSSYEGVVLADVTSTIRNKLVKECFDRNIRCYSVLKLSDIMIMNAEKIYLFDTPLLLFRNDGMSLLQSFLKRLMDIVLSIVFIVILSPVLLILALCVKGCDGGPVFFRQERLTKDGRLFRIIKFRSMQWKEEDTEEVCMTRKNDVRLTAIGDGLRRYHLDELPQLFNILKGEMSLVGPRPECPSIAEKYYEFLPEFRYRLKVKAGLTGYAQVYGKYNTTPYDKLKLDMQYIESYSLGMDIKLLFLTIKIFLKKDKTEGIDLWQKTAATEENLKQVENK